MNKYLKSLFALAITSMALIGCQADEIETSIKSKDLRNALKGKQVSVEYEAELSLMADTEDQETKATVAEHPGDAEDETLAAVSNVKCYDWNKTGIIPPNAFLN